MTQDLFANYSKSLSDSKEKLSTLYRLKSKNMTIDLGLLKLDMKSSDITTRKNIKTSARRLGRTEVELHRIKVKSRLFGTN